MKIRLLFLIVALLGPILLPGRPVSASSELVRLLEMPFSRVMLARTVEGRELMLRVVAHPRPTFDHFHDRLFESDMTALREEITTRLQESRKLFEEFKATQPEPPATKAESYTGYSETELRVIRRLAARKLKGSSKFLSGELSAPEIEFLHQAGTRAGEPRARFLADEPVDLAFELEPASLDRFSQKRGLRETRKFFEDMNSCVRSQPAGEASSARLRYILSNIGINETMTVGIQLGLAATGCKVIDVKDLSTDIMIAALSSTIGSRMVMGNNSLVMRWVRMASFGQSRAGVDAMLYTFAPTDPNSSAAPCAEAIVHNTRRRWEFNATYSVATTIIPVGLYALLSGLECVYPSARMANTAFGIRFGVGLATSFAYFKLRNTHMSVHVP